MPGLVFKWFPLCEFSLFDTFRVSSLVVQGLGVSAPTSKAQGLISSQEQRFYKWLVMTLSEIKTDIQKQETKDEHQNTHTYVYTLEQSENSPTKINYSRLTW